jgi:D-3-phosphoglycerate dehydrogenase
LPEKETPTVSLVDTSHFPDLEPLASQRLLNMAKIEVVNERVGRELGRAARNSIAMLVDSSTRVTPEVIAELAECKLIVTVSVGYDNIDLQEAARRGISVSNVPGYCTEEVADHTIGLLIVVTRNIFTLKKSVYDGKWDELAGGPIPRIRGMTLGIIGLGRIGTAVALRAKALGLNVIAYDPYIPNGRDTAVGVRCVELEALLKDSDIVSIHTPLTSETFHMIGAKQLEAMKDNVYIINTGRGPVIDNKALADALRSGKVAAAGLDVLEHEPPALDEPLLAMKQVVVTPHAGFMSLESAADRIGMAVDEVVRLLRHQHLRNTVNADLLQKLEPSTC